MTESVQGEVYNSKGASEGRREAHEPQKEGVEQQESKRKGWSSRKALGGGGSAICINEALVAAGLHLYIHMCWGSVGHEDVRAMHACTHACAHPRML